MPECVNEEHELPTVEAVLAGTLALMTGYSQALLAELHPEHRVLMGRKIGNNLALLAEHPQLSTPFKAMLGGLQRRWAQMAGCTAEAAPACHAARCAADATQPSPALGRVPAPTPFQPMVCEAPRRLQ
jgi:hypothetical protein